MRNSSCPIPVHPSQPIAGYPAAERGGRLAAAKGPAVRCGFGREKPEQGRRRPYLLDTNDPANPAHRLYPGELSPAATRRCASPGRLG